MWDGEATNFGALPPVELRRRRVRHGRARGRQSRVCGIGVVPWSARSRRRAWWLPLQLAGSKVRGRRRRASTNRVDGKWKTVQGRTVFHLLSTPLIVLARRSGRFLSPLGLLTTPASWKVEEAMAMRWRTTCMAGALGRGARARRHLRAAVRPRRSAAQRREPVVESKIRGLGEWRPRRGRTPRRPDGERNCPGMARNCEFRLVFPTIRVGMVV